MRWREVKQLHKQNRRLYQLRLRDQRGYGRRGARRGDDSDEDSDQYDEYSSEEYSSDEALEYVTDGKGALSGTTSARSGQRPDEIVGSLVVAPQSTGTGGGGGSSISQRIMRTCTIRTTRLHQRQGAAQALKHYGAHRRRSRRRAAARVRQQPGWPFGCARVRCAHQPREGV